MTRRAPIVVLVTSTLVVACAHRYRPAEYPIDPARIAPFRVGAPVRVVSDQASTEEHLVYDTMGGEWYTTYAAVTDVLARQLEGEIRKRGGTVSPDASRVIRVAVEEMKSREHVVVIR